MSTSNQDAAPTDVPADLGETYPSDLTHRQPPFHDNAASEDPPYDLEHSLPPIEQVQTNLALANAGTKKRTKRLYLFIGISILAVLAIVGFSVGIAVAKANISPGAARKKAISKLLSKAYKDAGLDASALSQTGSPQFNTIKWLAETDSRQVAVDDNLVQRYVLALMYNVLGGPNWTNKNVRFLSGDTECK
jgi:hypothetical protein